MRDIRYDSDSGLQLPREVQLKRLRRVIESELTDAQREVMLAYYFEEKSIAEIARERGVHRSTAGRILHRAEARIRRCLLY